MINDRILSVISDFTHIGQILNSFETGTISVANTGTEVATVRVVTQRSPEEVWIKVNEENSYASCNSDRNWFDYEVTEDGFILYAKVASESTQVQWYAEFAI